MPVWHCADVVAVRRYVMIMKTIADEDVKNNTCSGAGGISCLPH